MVFSLVLEMWKHNDGDPACAKGGQLGQYKGIAQEDPYQADFFRRKILWENQRRGDKTEEHP